MKHIIYFICSLAVAVTYLVKTWKFWYKKVGDAIDAVLVTFAITLIAFLLCYGLWEATK